jgi:uncharacterized protein YbjT (DUF2867 family)
MLILITGASGFIGQRLMEALQQGGHSVIAAGRAHVTRATQFIHADFTKDFSPDAWLPRLQRVDIVVNAVGILRENGSQTFEALHTRAPNGLFDACVIANVSRVIQISALGAQTGSSGYFRSKHAADEHLMSLPLKWTIVQPSLVYGANGTSARLFSLLATLPLIAVPGRGEQQVQPIHIDDVIEAIVRVCTQPIAVREVLPLVGPRAMTFADMLTTLRRTLGLAPAKLLSIPMPLMRIAARFGELSPRLLLDRETLQMLTAGNTADPARTAAALNRPPRDLASFVPQDVRASLAREAQLRWLLPLLRVSIAIVWIWTGIVSLGLYPREQSLLLLHRAGVPDALAPTMLYGAAVLDIVLGVLTLLMTRRRWLWLMQIALIVGYSIIISIKLPEFWLHPYGPILKNLPMLAALYLLYVLEERRWNT